MFSIETTLTKQLDTIITQYPTQHITDKTTFLSHLSSLWTNCYSHQVIVLVTELLIHDYINKCLEGTQSVETHVECIGNILSVLKHLQSVAYKIIDGCDYLDGTVLSDMLTNGNTGSHSTLPDSTGAVKASETNLTSGSGHINDEFDNVDGSEPNMTDQRTRNIQRTSLLNRVITIILNYITKLQNLMNLSELSPQQWRQSSVHYTYSDSNKRLLLNGAGVSVSYGVRYTGDVPIVSSPQLEDITKHMIQTMDNNCFGLVCTDKVY